ncbi:uncharacterized protein LOC115622855 [Scaptodrosophila lebanonensis]|uniref:Uncharacterized protein LOC115622855 n=1 Tax=Drosophila lebanonensis TaxID=7225 RepID=A0A6J2T9U6_DROLE|nr:uncharacterized protein LOC115622855 [Scaptodrosophila lebanonensis]
MAVVKKVKTNHTLKTKNAKLEKQKVPKALVEATVDTKKRTIVTPWRDTTEFNTVYNCLFSKTTTPSSLRKALSHMRVWNLRRGRFCPAAVLGTSVLVEAQLQDTQGNANIQTIYASAFTRFYNFMSSIMQGYNMITMYKTAHQLGLESFVVDLRHLCAHGQDLPPIDVLRNTAAYCLEWLQSYYWAPHHGTLQDLDAKKLQRKDKMKFETQVTELFAMYDLTLECHLRGAKKLKDVSKMKSSAEFNKLRVYCSQNKLKIIREVLAAVVNDLTAIVKRESIKALLDIYIASMFKMKYFFVAHVWKNEGEELLIEATQGFFRMLAKQGLIEKVFVAFVQLTENTNAEESKRQGASYWGYKLTETFSMLSRMKRMYKEELDLNSKFKATDFSTLNSSVQSKTMRTLIIHSGVDQSRTIIFGDSTKKPKTWVFERDFIKSRLGLLNKYSKPIVEGLLHLAEPPFGEDKIDELKLLCQIRTKHEDEDQSLLSDQAARENCEVDDLEKLISSIQKNKDADSDAEDTNFGIWTIDNSVDWSTCALGVLPWAQNC